jgi:hypothetical protein
MSVHAPLLNHLLKSPNPSKYRANPTKKNLDAVPHWFRPRPSQERISHPLVVDFLLWPGLRDQLVFEHNRYATNAEFSHRYCADLRFNWPYPDHEIFTFDTNRNSYTFSQRFKQSACDLKNWTMDAKFFETFEEMIGNVPMSRDTENFRFLQTPDGAMGFVGFPLGTREAL